MFVYVCVSMGGGSNLPTVNIEILACRKFGGLPRNHVNENIGGFKFGGSVRYRHKCIAKIFAFTL